MHCAIHVISIKQYNVAWMDVCAAVSRRIRNAAEILTQIQEKFEVFFIWNGSFRQIQVKKKKKKKEGLHRYLQGISPQN